MTAAKPVELLRHPLGWIALGFGSGLFPKAPGTAGSLVALLLWFLLLMKLHWLAQIGVIVLACALGVWASAWAIKQIRISDPGYIVWDEFVGMWIALLALPGGIIWPFIAFIMFRLFDVFKPWPVSWADRQVKGAWGVMLDDILAGLLAALSIQAIALALAATANSG